jgi:hypothetical protein
MIDLFEKAFDSFKYDGNVLIAKFLGCDNSKNIDGSYELYQYLECIEDGEGEQHFYLPEDMKFHESFDWIMPVVDEIGDIVYRVEEGKSWKTDYSYYELLAQISYKTSRTYIINDKESLWLACVEWIKWHNNNVKTDFTNNNTVQELQSKIDDKYLALLSLSDCNNDYMLEKMYDWQEDNTHIPWDKFKHYFKCDDCGNYSVEQCICYAR